MRTTLDIDRQLLDEVLRVTGEKSPSKAVSRVLEDFMYRRAIERFEDVAGKIEVDDAWRENEERELQDMRDQLKEGTKIDPR